MPPHYKVQKFKAQRLKTLHIQLEDYAKAHEVQMMAIGSKLRQLGLPLAQSRSQMV